MNVFSFICLVFLCSFSLFSCQNSSDKLPLDTKGREDFISFHNKFYEDSTFQLKRIEFPMLGYNPDGSEERFYWDINNWNILKKVDPENEQVQFLPFYDMGDLMRSRIIIQNRFMIENLFSLINNRWYMTQYSGMHDIKHFKGVKTTENNAEKTPS
ncbi:MAG: hypothetical protein MK207_04825 [Saprospiraceae bacterium]|nr:hypothetical protein [Saprospiraceae bacterium]